MKSMIVFSFPVRKLFEIKRSDQKEAVKRIAEINPPDKQLRMVKLVVSKIMEACII